MRDHIICFYLLNKKIIPKLVMLCTLIKSTMWYVIMKKMFAYFRVIAE